MDKATFEKGREIRSKVLGKEFVDAAFKAADGFNLPMQELVTEYCWGAVWGREALDRKTRSLLNLGMLTALNRSHELAVHVRGARTNGASVAEIQEVWNETAPSANLRASEYVVASAANVHGLVFNHEAITYYDTAYIES